MKVSLVALFVTAWLAAGAVAAGATPLRLSLVGTCVTQLHKNDVGVVNRGTVTCTTTGHCSCDGAAKLAYETITVSAGNGASGLEHGTITVREAHGSLSLKLRGTATAVGESKGTWELVAASSALRALTRSGSYTSTWTTNDAVLGTMSAKVRMALSISCWACGPAR